MSQTSFQSRDQVTEHLEILRKSFQLTGREMTRLIFKGLFRAPQSCGCPTCQARRVDRYDDTLGNDGPRSPLSGQKGPHA